MSGSKANKKGRSNAPDRFVMLYHYMLKSAAWETMRCNARAIYLELARRYNGSNNGKIIYSVRQAAQALAIGKGSAARSFKELEDRGFIVAVSKGAFSLKQRHATEWRLTEHTCDVSKALPTKDFMRWGPAGSLATAPCDGALASPAFRTGKRTNLTLVNYMCTPSGTVANAK